jgi:hypothetical protein
MYARIAAASWWAGHADSECRQFHYLSIHRYNAGVILVSFFSLD